MPGKRDEFGVRDGMSVTLTTPEGEEGNVVGLEPETAEAPTLPKPTDIAFEIRPHRTKGVGVFVATQAAPLTIDSTTWYESSDQAEEGIAWLKVHFGWYWQATVYKREEQEVIDPNTGEPRKDPEGNVLKVEVLTDAVLREGYWSHSYGRVFDPASLKELLT